MKTKLKSRRKTKVVPPRSIAFNQEVRRILLRGSHQGRGYDPKWDDWPNISRYALWCGCSHTALLKFANGLTERLDPDIMDVLAFLTGLYPTVGTKERKARIADAELWRKHDDTCDNYNHLMEYLQARYRRRVRQRRLARVEAEEGSIVAPPVAAQARGRANDGGRGERRGRVAG